MLPMGLFKLGSLRAARKSMRQAVQLANAVMSPFVPKTPARKKSVGPSATSVGTAEAAAALARKARLAARRVAQAPSPRTEGFHSAVFVYRRTEHRYKIYVPPLAPGQRVIGLVVMLHGCQQTPDDFAAGTRMNDHARDTQCIVVYPCQPASAHRQRCWNWFDPAAQVRGTGEPAWIAALARGTAKAWGLRRQQVFIAGLSAGGAMAATVAHVYPDVFAACGVHSGLAAGAARGMVGALSAMRHGASIGRPPPTRQVPTIVFHGDRDKTVHPRHGAHVVAAAMRRSASGVVLADPAATPEVTAMQTTGGHASTRHTYRNAQRRAVAERWEVHGMGHAWSGGSTRGSYVDPSGPDASALMLAFFKQVASGTRAKQ